MRLGSWVAGAAERHVDGRLERVAGQLEVPDHRRRPQATVLAGDRAALQVLDHRQNTPAVRIQCPGPSALTHIRTPCPSAWSPDWMAISVSPSAMDWSSNRWLTGVPPGWCRPA